MITRGEREASGLRTHRKPPGVPGARVFLPILILIVSGCAPRLPKPPPVTPGAEGGETIRRFLGETPCPGDLAADVELEIRPPERRTVRLVGGLRVSWPERVRLQLRFGPFTPVASIAVRGDSAFMSFPKMKAYWSGRSTERDASPATLASGLLWLICPSSLAGSIEEPVLDGDKDGWILRGRLSEWTPPVLASLRLSKGGGDIREITLADSTGAVLLRAERSGHIQVGRATIAERLRVETGAPPVTFAVRFMRARGDPRQPAGLFQIEVPAGARRLRTDELLDLIHAGGTHP